MVSPKMCTYSRSVIHLLYSRSLGILAVAMDEQQLQNILNSAINGQYECICTQNGTILLDNGTELPAEQQVQPCSTGGRFVR